jgi:hypothetical protein
MRAELTVKLSHAEVAEKYRDFSPIKQLAWHQIGLPDHASNVLEMPLAICTKLPRNLRL